MSGGTEPSEPLVSVVIIFCNEIEFLAEAVDSVEQQTMTAWELILVDDGSTDGSEELARSIAAERPDRVSYIRHPDGTTRGMSASRNRGVDAASGRWVAYLDADDRWLPQKLECQIALLNANPTATMVYGPLTRWYSWTGRPEDQGRDDRYGIHGDGFTLATDVLLEPPGWVAMFIRHKDLVPSGVVFEREHFLAVGGAEEIFTDNYEDAVALVKMGLWGAAYCASESWYLYRQYPRPTDRARRHRSRPDADRLRGADARLRFLDWVEAYLRSQGIDEPVLTSAVADARRQLLHPRRHSLHRALARGRRVAKRLVTGGGATAGDQVVG